MLMLVHDHSWAEIYWSETTGLWGLLIYRLDESLGRGGWVTTEEHRQYAFRQSAIRYAEKHLN